MLELTLDLNLQPFVHDQVYNLEDQVEVLQDEVEGLKDKTKIVVNRVGLDAGQIGLRKAQETIGREIFWQIPNDYRTMVEVRNNGVPLLEQFPKAGITQAVVTLAATLSGDEQNPAAGGDKAAAGGWLNFWPGKTPAKVEKKK